MKLNELPQNLRRWLVRRPERIGLDREGDVLRAVRLKKNEQGVLHLAAVASLKVDFANASDLEKQKVRTYLKELAGGMTRCALNVEHPTLRVRRMSFAQMPETDLLEAIRWHFREHVDCPIEQYKVGYTPLTGYEEDGQQAIMAYGVAEEAVREHLQFAKQLGFKLVSLEPAVTALLTSFHLNQLLEPKKFTVCVSMNEGITHFVVLTANLPLFSRPLAGLTYETLSKNVSRNLNMKADEARKLLDAWIVAENSQQPEVGIRALQELMGEENYKKLQATVVHYRSQLVVEIQRSIDAFCIMYNAEKVDRLYLCGVGVQLPGLVTHVSHSLGLEAEVCNPFQQVPLTASHMQLPPDLYTHMVATGLAV